MAADLRGNVELLTSSIATPPRGSLAYALAVTNIFPGCQHAPVRLRGTPAGRKHAHGLQSRPFSHLACKWTRPARPQGKWRPCSYALHKPSDSVRRLHLSSCQFSCEGRDDNPRLWNSRGKSNWPQHYTSQSCCKREVQTANGLVDVYFCRFGGTIAKCFIIRDRDTRPVLGVPVSHPVSCAPKKAADNKYSTN